MEGDIDGAGVGVRAGLGDDDGAGTIDTIGGVGMMDSLGAAGRSGLTGAVVVGVRTGRTAGAEGATGVAVTITVLSLRRLDETGTCGEADRSWAG